MEKCAICNGKVELVRHDMMVDVEGKNCKVEGILAEKCGECGEVYIGKEGNAYIDRQLAIFKNDGLDIQINEVLGAKSMTQESLGIAMGYPQKMAKQAIHQKMKSIGTGKLIFFCQAADILRVKLSDLVRYYPIREVDGVFVLDREVEIL
jgi:YgiT-type zinc finger domain-containing protein